MQLGDRQLNFDIGEIADTVGNAVTDLALSREEEDIFTEDNRRLVAGISRTVGQELIDQHSGDDGQIVVSAEEIFQIIDRALIRNNAHDVAKSLIIRRKTAPSRRNEPLSLGTGTRFGCEISLQGDPSFRGSGGLESEQDRGGGPERFPVPGNGLESGGRNCPGDERFSGPERTGIHSH